MAKVEIYTTPYCPYCLRAKALLSRKGVSYTEVDVTGDHEKRRWLLQVTGQRTVPQVFIDGRSMGGYDDIAALDRAGKLDPLLGL
jgi:glutaredoxin 3